MSKNFSTIFKEDDYSVNIDFDVPDISWDNSIEDIVSLSREVFKRVIAKVGLSKYANRIEVSITLTDDASIKKLNHQYLLKDKATNVLSFPAQDIISTKLEKTKIHDGFLLLGDIIFSYGTIKDESEKQGKDFYNHFAHLLVHGTLHLLGYDHEFEKEAIEMESIEIEILSGLDIKSPYSTIN